MNEFDSNITVILQYHSNKYHVDNSVNNIDRVDRIMIPIPEYHVNSAKHRYSDTRGKKIKNSELVNVDHPLDQTDETNQDSPVEPFEHLPIPRFSGVNLGRSNLV